MESWGDLGITVDGEIVDASAVWAGEDVRFGERFGFKRAVAYTDSDDTADVRYVVDRLGDRVLVEFPYLLAAGAEWVVLDPPTVYSAAASEGGDANIHWYYTGTYVHKHNIETTLGMYAASHASEVSYMSVFTIDPLTDGSFGTELDDCEIFDCEINFTRLSGTTTDNFAIAAVKTATSVEYSGIANHDLSTHPAVPTGPFPTWYQINAGVSWPATVPKGVSPSADFAHWSQAFPGAASIKIGDSSPMVQAFQRIYDGEYGNVFIFNKPNTNSGGMGLYGFDSGSGPIINIWYREQVQPEVQFLDYLTLDWAECVRLDETMAQIVCPITSSLAIDNYEMPSPEIVVSNSVAMEAVSPEIYSVSQLGASVCVMFVTHSLTGALTLSVSQATDVCQKVFSIPHEGGGGAEATNYLPQFQILRDEHAVTQGQIALVSEKIEAENQVLEERIVSVSEVVLSASAVLGAGLSGDIPGSLEAIAAGVDALYATAVAATTAIWKYKGYYAPLTGPIHGNAPDYRIVPTGALSHTECRQIWPEDAASGNYDDPIQTIWRVRWYPAIQSERIMHLEDRTAAPTENVSQGIGAWIEKGDGGPW